MKLSLPVATTASSGVTDPVTEPEDAADEPEPFVNVPGTTPEDTTQGLIAKALCNAPAFHFTKPRSLAHQKLLWYQLDFQNRVFRFADDLTEAFNYLVEEQRSLQANSLSSLGSGHAAHRRRRNNLSLGRETCARSTMAN